VLPLLSRSPSEQFRGIPLNQLEQMIQRDFGTFVCKTDDTGMGYLYVILGA